MWFFYLMAIVNVIAVYMPERYIHSDAKSVKVAQIIVDVLLLAGSFLYCYIRSSKINYNPCSKDCLSLAYTFIGFILLFGGIHISNVGVWSYIVVVFYILLSTMSKGFKLGIKVVFLALLSEMIIFGIKAALYGNAFYTIPYNVENQRIISYLFAYLVFILFVYLCLDIYRDYKFRQEQNRHLLAEIEQKYEELSKAKDEIKYNYEKLKESNEKLEEANKKLQTNVAELFTLQQISQAISSLVDLDELFENVNDIIAGVLGVSTSYIILYDENKKLFRFNNTHSKILEQMGMKSEFDCPFLTNVILTGRSILQNNFSGEDVYFKPIKEVGSFICSPIITKKRKLGIIFVGHNLNNAFDADNVKILNTICQQVGIAIENAELYNKMQELANKDYLTGLYNRMYFQEKLYEYIKNINSNIYNKPVSLIIIDIDHYKRINDAFGHIFGDKVLKQFGNILRDNSCREEYIPCRYGGEEFTILLPGYNIDQACQYAEKLRILIENTVIEDDLIKTGITASFGVCTFPGYAKNIDELLKHADDSLYLAKRSGRNCVKSCKDLS